MAAAGEVVGATDLALAAGAIEDAEKLLGAHETRLLQTASAGDLDRWLEAVGERSPALGARLAALRARLASGWWPPRRQRRPAAASVAAPLFGRLARGLATVRALSALAALVIFGLGWVLPLPEGLERAGLVTLGAIIATVPLLVADVLPDYIVMLFLTLALVLPGLVPPLGHPRRLRDARLAHDLHAPRGRRRGLPLGPHVPARAAVAPAPAAPLHPPEHGPLPDGRPDERRPRRAAPPGSPSACRSRAGSPTPWGSRREARGRPPSG